MRFISLILLISYYLVYNSSGNYEQQRVDDYRKNQQDSVITISISVVGDLMCHSPQFEYAKVEKDSFDFNPPFSLVKNILSSSDLTFGNLETVTAGKDFGGYSGFPRFNTPKSYIEALKNAGFDLLLTANNHCLDRGEIGIEKTIEEIKKNNLSYTGTFMSEKDRDSIRIFNIRGIRVAFLDYSYGTNGNAIPKNKNYLVNLINFNLIKHDIEQAKQNGADLVLVNYHFGEEYKREPVTFQKDVVDSTISFGADLIIGGHPHVIQPFEFFKTKNRYLDTGFVAYSMGNFFSNQRKRYTDAGMILTIRIQKDLNTNKMHIQEINYLPTWIFKGDISGKNEYKIIPANSDTSDLFFLSHRDSTIMNQAYDDTRFIISRYTKNQILKERKE
jgi:poly-gamma-glutamate capsule biosynthesis protein CapA/YwtB (metallophosphatase superfamily)